MLKITLTPEERNAVLEGGLLIEFATDETDSTIIETEEITEDNIENIVSGFLSEWGGNFHFKGASYIKYAIKLMYFNPNLKYITKEIYPSVAEKFNSTPSKVERCIRNWVKRSNLQTEFSNYGFLSYLIEELKNL